MGAANRFCPDAAASLPCQPLPHASAEADANVHYRASSSHPKHGSVGWPSPGEAQMSTPSGRVEGCNGSATPVHATLLVQALGTSVERCQQNYQSKGWGCGKGIQIHFQIPSEACRAVEERVGGDLRKVTSISHTPGQESLCLSYFDIDLSNL